ncbi:class E sortase [uncultured Intestinimonas sp.]|uniref:class E sortase n=1 Tax=uncultured Intestinimonas sp. TaxID=1689265 RepID=UPI00262DE1C2|nr:class E sortase [uncultured Intestinimonas sp.]
MRRPDRKILAGALAVLAAACLIAALALLRPREEPAPPAGTPAPSPSLAPTPEPEPVPTPSETPEETGDELPTGVWAITEERQAYVEDSLTLYIPCIDITRAVHDGTDEATLNRGVGLYEHAQLPGEGNRNVSMAGHRNGIDKNGNITPYAPFYYIDQVGEGDYLYLYDSEHVYRYLYEKTWVVEPDDWGPIATAGYSCITITSCTPIGVSDHRIVVRGALDQIFDYTEDFDFIAHVPEEEATESDAPVEET